MSLHYDGSRFYGWQLQKRERTVQGEIETAVERLTGRRRTVVASGRTDRGVHATGQIAAVDVPGRWSPAEFKRAANAVLPDDVWVREVRRVPSDFHPRYDAISRTYLYRIGLAAESRSPFLRPWCWPVRGDLDRSLMDEAARRLPGERSFLPFAKAGQPERGDRCTVRAAAWSDWADVGLAFTITANRYLHHMVRYLVGTMVEVALGRRPSGELWALLDTQGYEPGPVAGKRGPNAPVSGLATSPPAPAQGLFLTHVEYPAGVWAENGVASVPAWHPITNRTEAR